MIKKVKATILVDNYVFGIKGAQFIFNREPTQIVPYMFLTGEIPRVSRHE